MCSHHGTKTLQAPIPNCINEKYLPYYFQISVRAELTDIVPEVDPVEPISDELLDASSDQDTKAGLGTALNQLLIAPTVIAQTLVDNFGNNLQALVGLLNTTHNAFYVKQNSSLNAHADLLANFSAIHAEGLTNKTNAFLAHLDTNKEILQNISQAAVQAVTAWVNSTATLHTANLQSHIAVAQQIINATLQTKLAKDNATSIAHQTILRGVGTLLEQKMTQKQYFYGNLSMVIQNITNATVYDLQVKANQTTLKYEYFNNKTLIYCDAITGVMAALTDKHNRSAVAFVDKTSLLLNTVADIVNATHNISGTFFANKTDTLLTSVADVFDILANASTVKHQAFVSKFNTSVIALTSAIANVSESVGFYKANVTQSFQEKVAGLLQSKAILHANVSAALNTLVANLTESIAEKINNFTAMPSHKLKFATTRQSTDNVWFDVLTGFLDGANKQFAGAVNATTGAFQQGMGAMQAQINAIGVNAEAIAAQISSQLNTTMQHFQCVQGLIPKYIEVFASAAMRPIQCSGEVLGNSLKKTMASIEEIRLAANEIVDKAIASFKDCRATGQNNEICSANLMKSFAEVSTNSANKLQEFLTVTLPVQFQVSPCYTADTPSNTFENLQQEIKQCLA